MANGYEPAQVGDIIEVYGYPCRVVNVLPACTVEVERVDGKGYYRVSGVCRVPREKKEGR